MILKPKFPTELHKAAAEIVKDYFQSRPCVDTILVVNSCARGQAVSESDLDFAILVKPETVKREIKDIETNWQEYAQTNSVLLEYKYSSPFAHLHLDIIDGVYAPAIWEIGAGSDCFELEIGNQICYSAPMGNYGSYFKELHKTWSPYYNEDLRTSRLDMIVKACEYDLNHIAIFIKRELYFQAFDLLYKAFQEYLQVLFIADRTYPIAYNKWIKYQFINLLHKPDIYSKLLPILSISNIESDEINNNAMKLRELLNDVKNRI